MKYEVINTFIEREHKGIKYEKGDTYPKGNFKANAERVKYLQGTDNPYKIAFLGSEINSVKRKNTKKSDE